MKNRIQSYLLASLLTLAGVLLPSGLGVVARAVTQAPSITVNGTVTDGKLSVIGAGVIEKGTTNGTITDIDGNFTLKVAPNATLVISYIGFETQEVAVNGQTHLDIVLMEDSEALEEVVVVGYGTQKKKNVTGATVQVKGEDAAKLNTTSVLGALQSQTPGVNITSVNGQPGEGFKVNIRGLGTVGDSEPLYVIDGMIGGDINMLNPGDIESIDVLKDAASAAIYGSRAANGVILVTTKQGKKGKLQATFDAYYGWQNAANMPKLLTAQESMALTNESRFMKNLPLLDWKEQLGDRVWGMIQDGWQGTNWLESIKVKNAATQNYSFGLNGGSDVSRFSLGISYTSQDGIFGAPKASKYDRYTVRLNSDHTLVKGRDHDILKIGENVNFYYSTHHGISQNMVGYNDINVALNTTPLLPMYNAAGELYTQDDKSIDGWNYSNEEYNPILAVINETGNNMYRNFGLAAQVYLDLEPIKGLKYHGAFNFRRTSETGRRLISPYRGSTNKTSDAYNVTQEMKASNEISVENTISYKFPVFSGNAFDVLIGHTFEKTSYGERLYVSNSVPDGQQLPTMQPDMEHAWISNTANVLGSTSLKGNPFPDWSLLSFFGRINYNYRDRYLVTAIIRADGSSNFARGHRWGYFPSVSAGWTISEENFMKNSRSWLDQLKVRASWGQNGNQNIDNFQYISPVAFDLSHAYNFGDTILSTSGQKSTGAYAKTLANPDISWEKSEQLNIGLDAAFFNSRLRFNFDWYKKSTKDWLVQAPVLDTAGANPPYINGGDVENKGYEIGISWRDDVNKNFSYGVNVNLSYNRNEVTRIANPEGIVHGDKLVLSKSSNEFYRAQVGYPIGYFWGYETAGVFQNQQEIDSWRVAGNGFSSTDPRPGDIIYVDRDHNGVIDELDKTNIGNPNPDYRLGLGINLAWKGLDFSATATGSFGHQLLFVYRDKTTHAFERWHGEGTTNRYGDAIRYDDVNDTQLENGDYLRLQNVTLGYDFKKLFPRIPFSQLRLYVSGQNLYTFTNYPGMDPEVGFGGNDQIGNHRVWMSGIDIGSYPAARTIMIGINIKY